MTKSSPEKTKSLSQEEVDKRIDKKIKRLAKVFGLANLAVIVAAGFSLFGKFDDAWEASVDGRVESLIEDRFDIYSDHVKFNSDRVLNKSEVLINDLNVVDAKVSDANAKAAELLSAVSTSKNDSLLQLFDVIENKTDGDFFDLKNQISTLETRVNKSVMQCRVCVKTNNDGQCYPKNRTFCSDYASPGESVEWTAFIRDDTDKRSGGCGYSYAVECK